MLYSLDEICLIPALTSSIEHRRDTVIYDTHNKLPIFAAPMSCIIDTDNKDKFESVGINTIVPRSVNYSIRLQLLLEGCWVAFGFKEAESIYNTIELKNLNNKIKICIDQANGHMNSLLYLCSNLKDKFGDHIRIMTGNIANPNAYKCYARAGVDYIRCSIGGGNACTTSVQTGMHYPMGSLIINCLEQKRQVIKEKELGAVYKTVPKIIADGGFKRIDQVVKAIALGADYVMLGEILAKTTDACGKTYYKDTLGNYNPSTSKNNEYREYYGMSTEKAQIIINENSEFKVDGFVPKHSEGQVRYTKISYTLNEWVSDFEHALRSSMSYANARTLKEYKGLVNYNYMTATSYNAYMK